MLNGRADPSPEVIQDEQFVLICEKAGGVWTKVVICLAYSMTT